MANPAPFQTHGDQSKKRNWESKLYKDPDTVKLAEETCQFCMKMCRFACPVAESSKSEFLTPWGKISALSQAADRDPGASLSALACNHCNLCTAHCKHEIPVEAILTSRRKTIDASLLSLAQVESRLALKNAYLENKLQIPPPRQIKDSILFFPAQGIGRIKSVRDGSYGTRQNSPFVNQCLDILHHVYDPHNTYLAPPIDTGFDLYSAGLEAEFQEYAHSIRQDMTSFETVIFESAQDLYTIRELLGRYGDFQHTSYELLSDFLNRNYNNFSSTSGDWVLWLDGFSARASELNQVEGWDLLARKLKHKQVSWLPPEGSHRPPVWSAGWLPHYNMDEAMNWACMANDIVRDFNGEIIFSSVQDWQFAAKLKWKNKLTYVYDLVARSL